MQNRFGLLDTDVMPIFMIIALDIVITLRFSINCSKVICLPTVCVISREKSLVKTMAPGLSFIILFSDLSNPKPKNTVPQFIYFYFICTFYLLYLSLSDLILASNREGIDNPFIALGASICLFVQVLSLETCVFLLLD